MVRFLLALAVLSALNAPAAAQSIMRRPFMRATGEAVVSVPPDQVKINVGVVTQAATAQESGEQNATQTTAVLAALRQLLGQNADIKTVAYSVSPNYRTQPGGVPPQLIGYTTSNSLEVTSSDLTMAGRIIDAATQGGANNVSGLRFLLRDPMPQRAQALRMATMQARQQVEAIASGLSARVGSVLSAEEGSSVRLVGIQDRGTAAATPTPVEVGLVEVRATVTLEAELLQ